MAREKGKTLPRTRLTPSALVQRSAVPNLIHFGPILKGPRQKTMYFTMVPGNGPAGVLRAGSGLGGEGGEGKGVMHAKSVSCHRP